MSILFFALAEKELIPTTSTSTARQIKQTKRPVRQKEQQAETGTTYKESRTSSKTIYTTNVPSCWLYEIQINLISQASSVQISDNEPRGNWKIWYSRANQIQIQRTTLAPKTKYNIRSTISRQQDIRGLSTYRWHGTSVQERMLNILTCLRLTKNNNCCHNCGNEKEARDESEDSNSRENSTIIFRGLIMAEES